ncbi:hypothetical protein IWQ57_005743 [Coemansia nantahalensis]|uniref:Uncharacterized protein n=1 Tax=Coemansia nantahalensis TaxID=2789366 RepID=A0ACC1JLK5_9FUNG|nr:hypothetical protein IWQ57_005743 [Coemansia nantahalensis]
MALPAQRWCAGGQALPSVPHTPPASYSSGRRGSSTSYSSHSLGLDALDFGYDKQVVDSLVPPSPDGCSASSAASSALSPDEHARPSGTAGCSCRCPRCRRCEYRLPDVRLSLGDLVAPIDLADFNSFGDDDGCASTASPPRDTPCSSAAAAASVAAVPDKPAAGDGNALRLLLPLAGGHGGMFSLREIDEPAEEPAVAARQAPAPAMCGPEQPALNAEATVARLGAVDGIVAAAVPLPPAGSGRDAGPREPAIPDVIAGLGGTYTPDCILSSVACAGGCSCAQATAAAAARAAPCRLAEAVARGRCYVQFHRSLPTGAPPLDPNARPGAHGGLDVDSCTVPDPRSLATSIRTVDQPFESTQSITRLMTALRVHPVVVGRPFLGPSRAVLFSHLF